MIERYTEDQLKDRKFLFVSYSHSDTVVQQAVNYLLNDGVQLWYDKDLHNGENWEDRVDGVLKKDNCVGVIFFNSKNSFSSDAVDFERTLVIEERKKKGNAFKIFTIHIGDLSTLQIIKQVFDSVQNDVRALEYVMKTEKLSRILQLFGGKIIYNFINGFSLEESLSGFYASLEETAKEVVDKSCITLDKLCTDRPSDGDKPKIQVGRWQVNGQQKALRWKYINHQGDDMFFLSEDVVCFSKGGDMLLDWLNGPFKKQAFASHELENITIPLRLLGLNEINSIEDLTRESLTKDCQWWLADTNGNLQAVVREDGSVYESGYNNKRFEYGVRPVLVLKREQVDTINKLHV